MDARMASENHELTALYRRRVRRVRELEGGVVPLNAAVLVVSKGDDDLLQLEGQRAWHFPPAAEGGYAGYYPVLPGLRRGGHRPFGGVAGRGS